MFALDRSCRLCVHDATLSPLSAGVRGTLARAAQVLAPARWLALAVVVAVVLRLAGAAGEEAVMALAGTASLLYLATAAVSGMRFVALLDLAALSAVGLALIVGEGPASVMMVHVLWGALRMSLADGEGERRFAVAWSIFFAASALLLGLSA